MDHRGQISGLITGLLTVLILVNIGVVLFVIMKVDWQLLVEAPAAILDGFKNPTRTPVRRIKTTTTSSASAATAVATAGMPTAGMPTAGMPTAGMPTAGMPTAGMPTAGMPTAGMPTAGVISDPNLRLVCADESYAVAVSQVRPAVVNISCDSVSVSSTSKSLTSFDDPAPDLATLGGIGSGFVVNGRGYILTCQHIIARASNIYVTPFGPEVRKYRARVVAADQQLNLALLKITPAAELPEVILGDSDGMEVADRVLAIGSPFGLEQSVTHGIISDNSRDLLIGGVLYKGMLQTDVPINRGSSGGPLLNISGEVVAVNMAIYSPSGAYNGVSFALPINKAKPFVARVIP